MKEVPAIYAVRMNLQDDSGLSGPLETLADEQERIAAWSVLVPPDRALRIKRFRHWQDQWRSLAGDVLVRYVLRERFGLPASKILFKKNPYNKPVLAGEDVHFNVSHSGIWTVAAFHSMDIGIDIEQMGMADMELARSMFASSEYEALCSQPPEKRNRLFYDIWTRKESYLKALGAGLSLPLDSFSVTGEAGGNVGVARKGLSSVITEAGSARRWNLCQFQVDNDYSLSACSLSQDWPKRVVLVNADQLR
ncbi:4'-phosphopantetheinyl transferase family protein [Paenibacillus sp. CAU 1782]